MVELEIKDINDVCIKVKELVTNHSGEAVTYSIDNWPSTNAKDERALLEKVANSLGLLQLLGQPKIVNGKLDYKLIPRKSFWNHIVKEGLIKKTNKKKRLKIFFSFKWGLFLEDSPETGYKLNPRQVGYIRNLFDQCEIDYALDTKHGDKIATSNLSRDVKTINKNFCEKLGLTKPLVVGDKNSGYSINTPVYDVCLDKEYSTLLI